MPVHQHLVPPEARGQRLDAFLARRVPELSRSRLKALIESGEVTLDGAASKPSKLLKGGENVSIAIEPPRPALPQAEAIALAILFEDADLLVIDKAAGMVVHPGAGNHTGTLVNALLAHVKDLAGIGGELRPGIVHRIDKQTSGCLVVAKNEQALRALQAAFKGRQVTKVYRALVHGDPGPGGRFDTLHGRHPTDRKRFTGKVGKGRQAITDWVRLQKFEGASLVEISLLTGRTHQIRVHFAEAGYPLLGDEIYGGVKREKRMKPDEPALRASLALGRQALHAWKLAFPHPTGGRRLELEAPEPADFLEALAILRGK